MSFPISSPPLELIRCAECKKLTTWSNIRKIIESDGKFMEYCCNICAVSGEVI